MVRGNMIPTMSARQFGDVCLLDNTARKKKKVSIFQQSTVENSQEKNESGEEF